MCKTYVLSLYFLFSSFILPLLVFLFVCKFLLFFECNIRNNIVKNTKGLRVSLLSHFSYYFLNYFSRLILCYDSIYKFGWFIRYVVSNFISSFESRREIASISECIKHQQLGVFSQFLSTYENLFRENFKVFSSKFTKPLISYLMFLPQLCQWLIFVFSPL